MTATSTEASVTFVHSPSFAELLDRLGITLALTTYQAGKLCFLSNYQQRVRMLMRTYNKAMGLFVHPGGMLLATRNQIWSFVKAPQLLAIHYPDRDYDNLFLPQCSYVTGDVAAHDVFLLGGDIHLVNTLFSCVARISPTASFVPIWQPRFISRLAPEDRCHLNSVALDAEGRLRYAAALSTTDFATGWRPEKNSGGCLIDVEANEVIYKGCAMPHSPRLYNGRLWLLNSGRGELGTFDPQAGRWEPLAQLPGFTRGLALVGPYAFVGLSKIREKATFGGSPIDNGGLQCGVYAVNLRSGAVEAWLSFDTGIEEIYDIQVIEGCRHPFVLGFQKEDINRVYNFRE